MHLRRDNLQHLFLFLYINIFAISTLPPSHAEVISGTTVGWAASLDENGDGLLEPNWLTIGDQQNHVTMEWSENTADKGWFYGGTNSFRDTDVAFAEGVTDNSEIMDASAYTLHGDFVGPHCCGQCSELGSGDFMIWKNRNTGQYGVLRIESIYDIREPFRNMPIFAGLTGVWWFQTDGTGDFSSGENDDVDLVVQGISIPYPTTGIGEGFSINLSIRNLGTHNSAGTMLQYYVSIDGEITNDDTEVKSVAISSVPKIGPIQDSSMLSISNNGIYWVGACIDAVQGEVSTGNNCSSGTRVVVGDVGEDVTPPILEVSTYFPSPTISLPIIAGNSSDDESGVQIVELEITGGAKSVQTVNGELMEGPPA